MGAFGKRMVRRGRGVYAESIEAAVGLLRSWLSEGDAVLLKGSRGLRLEQVFDLYYKD